ncbi:hypothetical protein [Chitinivorax sp. B]|uniref:hypothetical protein n=1 Tax=Chitinivorax sp. B TaxID=2502235 RepID=UPI0010F45FAB|nr:hypothetical protein [Chitinivorax sp. B]
MQNKALKWLAGGIVGFGLVAGSAYANDDDIAESAALPRNTLTVRMDKLKHSFDFVDGLQGWETGFADYPNGEESFYQLTAMHARLPAPHNNKFGIYLSGNNHSDDLFMYARRPLGGLHPLTYYNVTIDVNLLANVATGCYGIGGAPGEAVAVKVGATSFAPADAVYLDGWIRFLADKGNQMNSGANAVVVGNLAGAGKCTATNPFSMRVLNNRAKPIKVRTDQYGALTIFVGTDSGFEGTSSYYISKVRVTARKALDQ